MAAPKGLNPHAPEYVPLFHKTTPSTLIPTLSSHSSVPSSPPLPLPPPPVAEPPPATVVRHLAPPRRPPRFCGRGTGRRRELGFRPHQNRKEVPFVWRRGNLGNKNNDREIHQDHLHRRCERRAFLAKHEVLPLSLLEGKTTVMIKNIPKEYNYALFLKFLDEYCMSEKQKSKPDKEDEEGLVVSAFDFMYLPVDFSNGYCRGFAFVNFTDPRAVWKFRKACNGKRWDLFESPKIREIVCAIIQGKEAMVKHFENSTFMCESDEFLPVCFSPPRDGSVDQVVEETRIGRRISSVKTNA